MSLFNRAEVIDQNFTRWVAAGEFPQAKTAISLPQNDILKTDLISLFESQITSRHMDIFARQLKDSGECFYTIGKDNSKLDVGLWILVLDCRSDSNGFVVLD